MVSISMKNEKFLLNFFNLFKIFNSMQQQKHNIELKNVHKY